MLTVFGCKVVFAQDPHFSQYSSNPLYVNPGHAGFHYNLQAVANYKQQWKSVASPFKTASFSFDGNLNKDKRKRGSLGIGVQFLNDRSGDANLGLTQGNLNLSSVLQLDKFSKLSFGIMTGFGQRSIDYSSLRWESQYINGAFNSAQLSGENLNTSTFTYMDAGTGFVWSYGKEQGYITQNNGTKINIGASVYHFGLPSTSFYGSTAEKLNSKFIGFASVQIGRENTNLSVIPELYYVQQRKQKEIIIGSAFRYLIKEGSHYTGNIQTSAISFAINYRVLDALITSVFLEYSYYKIGFTYDVNISSLTPTSKSRGGFELSLRYVRPNPFSNNFKSYY